MRQPIWSPGSDGKMQFSTRSTSFGRAWTRFDANLYETSGGLAAAPLLLRHSVSMHVGAPLRATCRCDGAVSRRLQCPGDIDVVPAGYSGVWEDDGPTTMLVISVSPSLIETAAAEMGMNPDRVSIRPQLARAAAAGERPSQASFGAR